MNKEKLDQITKNKLNLQTFKKIVQEAIYTPSQVADYATIREAINFSTFLENYRIYKVTNIREHIKSELIPESLEETLTKDLDQQIDQFAKTIRQFRNYHDDDYVRLKDSKNIKIDTITKQELKDIVEDIKQHF